MLPTLPENEKKQTLFSRDFILLFCMAMCNNSYMAVFYCFEQWLEGLQVSPNWRGILLSALFAMVLLWRPLASIVLLSRSKLPALLVTICLSSCIMLAYPFIHGPDSIWLILGGLVGAFMILVARPLTVFTCLLPFRKFTTKARLYVSWVGLRGAVPILFAIYPLMAHVENAGLLFNVVFLGTIISLLVQGTTVSGMANLLGLAYEERESAFSVDMHQDMKSALTEVEVNETMLESGHTLKDITLPENTLVMMVCRDGEYFVPQGKTELKLGDKLLVISDRSEELATTYKDMGIDDVMKLG